MGTRHRQCVISKEGDLKISQYGQWDGYPSGQGADILYFLRNNDLDRYHEEVIKVRIMTEADQMKVDRYVYRSMV